MGWLKPNCPPLIRWRSRICPSPARIRTDRWRYTEWCDLKQNLVGTKLYDETNEPQDNSNLANDSAHKQTVSDFARQLHAEWKAAKP